MDKDSSSEILTDKTALPGQQVYLVY